MGGVLYRSALNGAAAGSKVFSSTAKTPPFCVWQQYVTLSVCLPVLLQQSQAILKAIHTYVAELRSGVPAQHSGSSAANQASTPYPAASAAAAAASSNGVKSSSTPAAATAAPAAAKAASRSRHKVELTERFYAKAQDIYECFVVHGRVQAFTRSPAVVDPQPGGSFSWFNGHVQVRPREALRHHCCVLQPPSVFTYVSRARRGAASAIANFKQASHLRLLTLEGSMMSGRHRCGCWLFEHVARRLLAECF